MGTFLLYANELVKLTPVIHFTNPKAQEDTDDFTVFLLFWDLRM